MQEHENGSRGGRLRRLIDLENLDEGRAVGWVEDDFHHFGVAVEHDGTTVTAVRVDPVRYPWATCAQVGAPLQDLVGKPLVARASEIGTLVEMREQCTHVFDLAGLVLAQIRRAESRRRYEVVVDDLEILRWENGRPQFGATEARLDLNGERVMAWQVDHNVIVGPQQFAGQALDTGFRAWTEAMDLPAAEYATILRRAILVAGGRAVDHDQVPSAGALKLPALCFSFQPQRREQAVRMVGSTRNYEASADGMLASLGSLP
ncbi:DUF2889 domain-containing protein [Massilia putida]|uniref:DUF2889 domain-containing protein n=1 Tax=Massilia putida TaxID=1141883 RepID=UPI000952E1E2|nr:DUF2889 domain-containing protein [Massilia putida]